MPQPLPQASDAASERWTQPREAGTATSVALRKQAEQRAEVFCKLGQRLATIVTPREAGQVVLEVAEALWQWDACELDLCSRYFTSVTTVLCVDTVNGQRIELSPGLGTGRISAIGRRALLEGPQLVLRPVAAPQPPEVFAFAAEARPVASAMCVPIRSDSRAVGILSLQSYAPQAYTRDDLITLQALADHCGGALERIRAESALLESSEHLRLALAAGKMGTWTRDLEGSQAVYASPELEVILGLRPGEFPGTEEAFYEMVHPEDRARLQHAVEEAIRIKSDYEVECRFRRPDGTAGWLLGRGRAYCDAAGKPVRLTGVAIDITASKQADAELTRLNAELEQRVKARTAQLEAANNDLESFAYSVSHDLRAPLRGIRGFSEVLLEQHAGRLDTEGRELLRRVCESSHRMNGLIDDLLKLSRVGRSEMSRRRVDLSAVATTAAAHLRQLEPGRAVDVKIEPGLYTQGDERLLGIVLDNLLSNAWKFTQQRPNARIEFGRTTEPEPAFYVRDNGVGFEPELAHKLFGVFQRLHSGAQFPGTGIGLATVRRIVQRHGGRTWAEGVVNQGAVFYFTLPETGSLEL